MPWWALLIEVWIVWLLWCVGALAGRALSYARRGVPVDHLSGVSLAPIIPLFPLGFWTVAIVTDVFVNPWGTIVVGAFHAILGVSFAIGILRDWLGLLSLNR